MPYRKEKVNELLKRNLAPLVQDFVAKETKEDVLITVVRVSTDKNLKKAKIYLTVYPQKKASAILAELKKDKGQFRYILANKLTLFRMPEIEFILEGV